MADEIKTAVDAAADTAKTATEASGETAKAATETASKASKRTAKAAEATAKKSSSRAAKAQRKTKTNKTSKPRKAVRKPAPAAANERIEDVNFTPNNLFAGFGGFPTAPFQSMFADAGERGQDAVRRSQQAVEDLADLTRANVEAFVDAGRIAAEGARTIGQDVVETSRESLEQTAEAVRSLAEAKSATEFVQLQGEFARASFDRMVNESSRLTESLVKLAGEAFQPISSRASVNAERLNQFVA